MSRIVQLIPTLDRIGGAERQVMLLAKGLARRKWDVDVIAMSGTGGAAGEELAAAGAGFESLAMKSIVDPRGWWRLHRWLALKRPNILHAHLPQAAWFARCSRVLSGRCIVVDTIHTSNPGRLGRGIAYRITDRFADCVTAVTGAAADAYLAEGMVAGTHLEILPNGIDAAEWHPDAQVRCRVRRELGAGNEFLWIATARLEPAKDWGTLLRAFKAIGEPCSLLIAGDGSLRESLCQLAQDLELAKHVRFLGYVDDVRRVLQGADGFVLSARSEGLPMGLLEASAWGVPAVATDVPGVRDALAHGVTGWIAKPGDAQELARAMQRLMQMPCEQRVQMGMRARRFVAERYDMEMVLDRWEELYGELLCSRALAAAFTH